MTFLRSTTPPMQFCVESSRSPSPLVAGSPSQEEIWEEILSSPFDTSKVTKELINAYNVNPSQYAASKTFELAYHFFKKNHNLSELLKLKPLVCFTPPAVTQALVRMPSWEKLDALNFYFFLFVEKDHFFYKIKIIKEILLNTSYPDNRPVFEKFLSKESAGNFFFILNYFKKEKSNIPPKEYKLLCDKFIGQLNAKREAESVELKTIGAVIIEIADSFNNHKQYVGHEELEFMLKLICKLYLNDEFPTVFSDIQCADLVVPLLKLNSKHQVFQMIIISFMMKCEGNPKDRLQFLRAAFSLNSLWYDSAIEAATFITKVTNTGDQFFTLFQRLLKLLGAGHREESQLFFSYYPFLNKYNAGTFVRILFNYGYYNNIAYNHSSCLTIATLMNDKVFDILYFVNKLRANFTLNDQQVLDYKRMVLLQCKTLNCSAPNMLIILGFVFPLLKQNPQEFNELRSKIDLLLSLQTYPIINFYKEIKRRDGVFVSQMIQLKLVLYKRYLDNLLSLYDTETAVKFKAVNSYFLRIYVLSSFQDVIKAYDADAARDEVPIALFKNSVYETLIQTWLESPPYQGEFDKICSIIESGGLCKQFSSNEAEASVGVAKEWIKVYLNGKTHLLTPMGAG